MWGGVGRCGMMWLMWLPECVSRAQLAPAPCPLAASLSSTVLAPTWPPQGLLGRLEHGRAGLRVQAQADDRALVRLREAGVGKGRGGRAERPAGSFFLTFGLHLDL